MVHTFFLAVLLLQVPLASHPSTESETLEGKLRVRLRHYTLDEETFLQALTRFAAEFEIPVGIEWSRTPATLQRVRVSWQDVTVHQVIESLVRSQPGYDFEISGGIVHIHPRETLGDARNFLNLGIDQFEVNNEFVGMASRRLRERIRRTLGHSRPPKPGVGEAGSMATGLGDRKISLKLQNVAVRHVLDKLILVADFRVWIVTYSPTALTESGFRQVSSPEGNLLPEREQPVWSLLVWSYDPILRVFRTDWKYESPAAKDANPSKVAPKWRPSWCAADPRALNTTDRLACSVGTLACRL
jgi:hypothetical protein